MELVLTGEDTGTVDSSVSSQQDRDPLLSTPSVPILPILMLLCPARSHQPPTCKGHGPGPTQGHKPPVAPHPHCHSPRMRATAIGAMRQEQLGDSETAAEEGSGQEQLFVSKGEEVT